MRFFHFPSLRRGVWRRSFFLLLGVSTLTLSASFAQEVREWRDAAGRPIMTSTNKKLVGTLDPEYDDPAKVRINMGDKTFRFTLANLSEADQKYVAGERAKKTASNKPATESKPTANKPATESKPTAAPKPTANKPTATSKPTSNKPANAPKPTANKPANETKPTANKPATESKPTANKPANESKPTANKPANETKPTAPKPATESKPTANKPATESKPTANKPATESKPTSTKPATESKPTSTKPATESKPTSTKPATAAKPTASKPATAAKPTATKPETASKPTASASTRTTVSNPAPAQAEDASRALASIPKDGVKRALLVGVDDYAEFADLKYAVADVEAIRERLIGLGFKPENIVELKSTSPANLRPSQRYIRRQVDALFKAAGPNDLLFLHFSGHGFQTDGVVRFAPEDATATGDENVLDPETTISLTEIVERLTSSQAKFKWLIVDACRENPTGTRSAAANARALKNIDPRKGVLVLQSCAEGELSFEDAEAGRGLFTGRLLEAFDGKADFDGDGALSALDVCKYVSEQTLAASKTRFNATQTPYFSGEFADFIVAEDLKRHGLTREDWSQAEALYNEAIEQVREKDFEAALQKIEAALEIVAEVPETEDAKKRYLERKTMIDYLVDGEQKVVKLDAPSEETNDEFGKPNKFVSNVEQLTYAVENAQDGDIIQLAKGDYELDEELVVPVETKISLVGATGQKEDVRILQPLALDSERAPNQDEREKHDSVITLKEGSRIKLADLTLDSKNEHALETDNFYEQNQECEETIIRCRMSAVKTALHVGKGRVILKDSEFIAHDGIGCDVFEAALTAENCDITGELELSAYKIETRIDSSIKKCNIHDAEYACVDISGDENNNDLFRCEIVDCEIYNCRDGSGIDVDNGAYAIIRDCKIRNCHNDIGSAAGINIDTYSDEKPARVTVTDTTIDNCDNGIHNDASECVATNVTISNCNVASSISGDNDQKAFFTGTDITFKNVKREWYLTDHYVVTHNNQAITKSSPWRKNTASALPTQANLTINSPTQTVKTVKELVAAVENAKDGEVIQISRGTYQLEETLKIDKMKEITLIGETGDKDDVRLLGVDDTVIEIYNAAAKLADLTLEVTGKGYAINADGDTTLIRCRVTSDNYSTIDLSSGKLTLRDCEIRNQASEYRNAINVGCNHTLGAAGSLDAENCDFLGRVDLRGTDPSIIKKCKIHDDQYRGISVSGYDDEENDQPRCEIIDCEIYNCGGGISATNRAQVTVNGGEIRECRNDSGFATAVSANNASTYVKLNNVKISDCDQGVFSYDGSVCEATNLTFANVKDLWSVDDKSRITHNGRQMTNSYY